MKEASQALLEGTRLGDVTVIRFAHRTVLDADAIERVGRRLLELAQAGPGQKFVIDFSMVESLTSAMLGKFIGLYNTLEAGGGRLAFCGVGPFLRQIFTLCNIPKTIPIHADRDEAVRALAGHPAETA